MIKTDKKSLRFKVLTYVFITSALLILLLGSVVIYQVSALTNKIAQEDLLEQARKIASSLEYNWLGKFSLDLPARYASYYDPQTHHHQFAVLNSSGQTLFQSEKFMEEKIRPTLDKGGKYYFSFDGEGGERFVGLKYDYLFEGQIYPIFVIENEEIFSLFLTSLENDFIFKLFLYGTPLLLLQGLLIILIFRSALKPVVQASKDARNIKYNNLSYRLDEKNMHSEFLPLIQSVNSSLERLEYSAEAQKFFIANAAHELRTPISILKARITSLKNEQEVYMLNQDLRTINRLISQLLDISRLDLAEAAPKEKISLNNIAQKACEDMGALFVAKNKELSLEQKEQNQIIKGNEDTLLRALLNLLENALKHTPEDTPVQMIVTDGKIIVRDYGKPIPDEYSEKIFDRFEKLPDSVNTKGSGLGLAIVKKAAELHNAKIYIERREDGNDFVLDFAGEEQQLPQAA